MTIQKIMKNELKAFDRRDSVVFRNSMSMSRKFSMDLSHVADGNKSSYIYQEKTIDPFILRELFTQKKS